MSSRCRFPQPGHDFAPRARAHTLELEAVLLEVLALLEKVSARIHLSSSRVRLHHFIDHARLHTRRLLLGDRRHQFALLLQVAVVLLLLFGALARGDLLGEESEDCQRKLTQVARRRLDEMRSQHLGRIGQRRRVLRRPKRLEQANEQVAVDALGELACERREVGVLPEHGVEGGTCETALHRDTSAWESPKADCRGKYFVKYMHGEYVSKDARVRKQRSRVRKQG